MPNFLEVIPGICISTRRIESIEIKEHDEQWLVLVFTDMRNEDDKPISYVYSQLSNRAAALAVAHKLVDRCGGGLYIAEVQA